MPTGCRTDSLQSFHPVSAQHADSRIASRLKPKACTNKARHGRLRSVTFQDIVFASSAASVATKMTLKHAVGESVVVPGLRMIDHTFQVPLDHSNQQGATISLFVRDVSALSKIGHKLPTLLFLQGGPGFEAPRPVESSSWIKCATAHFNVLLMDQRGTGRSSPITTANLVARGSAKQQAFYLQHFRADSIVADAELVRETLLISSDAQNSRWSLLGQSFGGFCAVQYLSAAPQALTEVMLTGGLPPRIDSHCAAEDAYRHLYPRVIAQNHKFYKRFPSDVARVQRIVTYLSEQPGGGLRLANGDHLTPRAFQLLGLGLGGGGGMERLHWLLERAFDEEIDQLSPTFTSGWQASMPWDTNPLYAIMHESIYCNLGASNWAAHRVRQQDFADDFDAIAAANAGKPVLMTGEMVFPWMFEDFASLRKLQETAEVIAAKSDWGAMYDSTALGKNQVPVASATYYEDLYVDFELAQETASKILGVRQWVTNEYMHSGIRDDGARILERLLGIVRGSIPLT
ncbi:MAG: peptidase family [Trebouxia sp. A1-2]|nr:MAG: peptidase family [Trebouxia sp. A1-2]